MRGDLGLDAGRGQSVFEIDQSLVDDGRLKKVARENLKVGQEIKLDDGTKVRFDGVGHWVSLQVSHDPTQGSCSASPSRCSSASARRCWSSAAGCGCG